MNKEELLRLMEEFKESGIKARVLTESEKEKIPHNLLEKAKEDGKTIDDILMFESFSGFTLDEKFNFSEDYNEETSQLLDACKKKHEKDGRQVYLSVVSEGNAVTQNKTMYSYELLNEALFNNKKFKRRLKTKEVKMQADHPDWFSQESVLKSSAVIHDLIWEKIDGDPTKLIDKEPSQTSKKNVESNGKPKIRLFASFELMGQYKDHLEDCIKKSRVGISSRGYGYGEWVVNSQDERLYYELLAMEIHTWDLVETPSVAVATFTADGKLNKNDDMEKEEESLSNNLNTSGTNESHAYNVEHENDSKIENNILQEEKVMNPKEVLEFLNNTVNGKEIAESIVKESAEVKELTEKVAEVETKLAEAEETKVQLSEEIDSAKKLNDELKVQNETLNKQVEEIKKAEFEAKKESFYAQYNKDFAEKLAEDLNSCETLESFEAKAQMLVKYLPESALVKGDVEEVEESVVEKLVEGSEETVEESEVEVPEETEVSESIHPLQKNALRFDI